MCVLLVHAVNDDKKRVRKEVEFVADQQNETALKGLLTWIEIPMAGSTFYY